MNWDLLAKLGLNYVASFGLVAITYLASVKLVEFSRKKKPTAGQTMQVPTRSCGNCQYLSVCSGQLFCGHMASGGGRTQMSNLCPWYQPQGTMSERQILANYLNICYAIVHKD